MTRCFFSLFYLCDENVAFCPMCYPISKREKSKRKEEDKMSERKAPREKHRRSGTVSTGRQHVARRRRKLRPSLRIHHISNKNLPKLVSKTENRRGNQRERRGRADWIFRRYAIGAEIGHYLGALRAWEGAVMDDNATTIMDERKRERIGVAVRQLETALGDMPPGLIRMTMCRQ